MTVSDKLISVRHTIEILNWSTIVVSILFVITLITAIVLTAKMKRKAFFVFATFGLIFLIAISCGLDFAQRNRYQDYENQTNYYYIHTRVPPSQSKKLKFNVFEKRIKQIHSIDQKVISKINKQREQNS